MTKPCKRHALTAFACVAVNCCVRLVIDTNILVSALLGGQSNAVILLDQWKMRRFELLTCEEQLIELARVTRYPRIQERITPSVAGFLVNQLRKVAVVVDDVPAPDISPDPYDDWLLGLAQKGRADFIVSGDKRHVRELGKYRTTSIVTLAQMLGLLQR